MQSPCKFCKKLHIQPEKKRFSNDKNEKLGRPRKCIAKCDKLKNYQELLMRTEHYNVVKSRNDWSEEDYAEKEEM